MPCPSDWFVLLYAILKLHSFPFIIGIYFMRTVFCTVYFLSEYFCVFSKMDYIFLLFVYWIDIKHIKTIFPVIQPLNLWVKGVNSKKTRWCLPIGHNMCLEYVGIWSDTKKNRVTWLSQLPLLKCVRIPFSKHSKQYFGKLGFFLLQYWMDFAKTVWS